ncbi:MAG: M28 family peptidase [Bacteroidales bacterium]|nr:M28 family peptidase [Bacteroidales bacterium]
MKKFTFVAIAACLLVAGCKGGAQKNATETQSIDYSAVAIPAFSADSAYQYVADQVACGFRTPGSEGQRKCASYLISQMQRWCDTVIVQNFSTTLWNGQAVNGKNIIASIEPVAGQTAAKRVLYGAHWDSRLWADHDPDPANHHSPILGANDGASGVGVLMELARVISSQRPEVAVDIIFFDIEDQGVPEWADTYEEDCWCKGSQYWSANPHTPYYSAIYGVLLDMVGTPKPRYTKEEVSRTFASGIMNKMWNAAAALGYQNIFLNNETASILDDHYYVNRIAGIPMLDIVQNDPSGSFFAYWHTLGDNMDHVDKTSLGICGEVLLKTLYADY